MMNLFRIIFNKFNCLGDKQKHFIIGFFICLIAGAFGFILVLGAAFGKETGDYQHGGKFDLLDIAATMIGATIGTFLNYWFLWAILTVI